MGEVHANHPRVGPMQVAPHKFAPISRFFNRGRCRHCLVHEDRHPLSNWTWSRFRDDKGKPLIG